MAASELDLLKALEAMAPHDLAESWDNIGLLVESCSVDRSITKVLLTIDLDADVLAEAIGLGAQHIIAYHPPIFSGLKRLRVGDPHERVIIEAIREGINVYSPHTAWDAARDGLCDWLVGLFPGATNLGPLAAASVDGSVGAGRSARLSQVVSLADLIQQLKSGLGLKSVRCASAAPPEQTMVSTFAVCPGAGGSLFAETSGIDLFITGEMRHHDVREKVAAGASVVLTEHTNCERGYLPIAAERLRKALPGIVFLVAETDRDPLAPA